MKSTSEFHRLARSETGSTVVEFALIAAILVSLLIGVVEFGRALFIRNQLSFAADIAARRILIEPTVVESDLEMAIRDRISSDQALLEIQFGAEVINGASFRTISVRQPLTLLIPNLSASGIVVAVERRVPVL